MKYFSGSLIFSTIILFIFSCSVPSGALIELPQISSNDIIISHYAYQLKYNPNTKQADWIAYELLDSELEANFERTDKFTDDPLLNGKTANNNDYKGSGYDRGHLAPAADMVWNKQAMDESFYFSNISPQIPNFNRGIWKKLESYSRKVAQEYGHVFITTGPIFKEEEKGLIGDNKIPVPTHFFKSLLIYSDSIKEAVGFIFPHKKISGNFYEYAVSIDSLESFSNFNFYHILPNKDEKVIEKTLHLDFWETSIQ